MLKKELCEIVIVVFLVTGYCLLLVESSILENSNCEYSEKSSDQGKTWFLNAQKEKINPHQCHWNFSVEEGRILVINSTSIYMPNDHFQLADCLKFHERKASDGSFQEVPISSNYPSTDMCFTGQVNISFNNAECPPRDTTHSLHMNVQAAKPNHVLCDSITTGWIYQCDGNIAKKVHVTASCSNHNMRPVTNTPEEFQLFGKSENEPVTDGLRYLPLYIAVPLACFAVGIIIGTVVYKRKQSGLRNPVDNTCYRVVLDHSLPHLQILPRDYETITSYLRPVSCRRDTSDSRATTPPRSSSSWGPNTDSLDSFDQPDTFLQDPVMIPSAVATNININTEVKMIATDDGNGDI
jgi:hypothetical protein